MSQPSNAPNRDRPTFDPQFYPRLFDLIVDHLTLGDLIPLRGVSRYVMANVELRLARHIVLTNVNNRVIPGLPLPGNPRFPKRNFWQGKALREAVRVIDIPGGPNNNPLLDLPKRAYPLTLRNLPNVQVIRDFSGRFDGDCIVMPQAREWISHLGWQVSDGTVPKTVTERVVLVCNGRPGDEWEYMLPGRGVHVTIIFGNYWWNDIHHDYPEYDFCEACGEYHHDPMFCSEGLAHLESNSTTLTDVVAMVGCAIANHPVIEGGDDETTFTLVGMDGFLASFRGDLPEAREELVDKIAASSLHSKDDVKRRLTFMTRAQYRKHVGTEHFQLQTGAAT